MASLFHEYRSGLFALAFILLLGAASLTVVGEDQQAVIERMGQPERVINRFHPGGASGAGIVAKIPLVESVVWLPRGLVTFSHAAKRVKSADQQWLLVDTDVTYRIIDPAKLAGSLGSAEKIDDQLKSLLPAVLDQELGQHDVIDIARPGAGGANPAMLRALDARTRQYGIQVVDLRLARVLLDEGSLRSAYDRMRLRHEGSLAEIEKRSADDALSIASSAEADATARRKLSSDKDPQFYSFFRAMRSYDELYGDPKRKNATTIILPPDSGYLKHFGGN